MTENAFASTPEELNGKETDVGGTIFLLKGLNESNRDFIVKVSELGGQDIGKVLAKNLPEILADIVVVGWDSLELEGKEVKYGRANAVKVFTRHPKLATAVFNAASEIGNDESETLAEDVEDLGKS